MSAVALALVLAAAVFHAGWNRLLHGAEDRLAAIAVSGIIAGLLLSPATVAAPPRHVLPLVALSAAAETAYALCLTAAYARGALSLTYPIGRGTAPLLVTVGGLFVLAQRPSIVTVAGAGALLAGLTLVATAGDHPRRGTAVGFAVLTGTAIASYSLIDARAVEVTSPAGYLGPVLFLSGLALTAIVHHPARLRAALRPGLLIAVGSVTAYLLVLFAFQRAHAGRVATIREVSVLLAILIAREKTGRQVWLGGVLVVAGAVLAAA
ncbi:MAG TPA: EamA family transporter [Chloroflexota bacterium]|nr:EamA family transporter [Chloroflexota bacterium]